MQPVSEFICEKANISHILMKLYLFWQFQTFKKILIKADSYLHGHLPGPGVWYGFLSIYNA